VPQTHHELKWQLADTRGVRVTMGTAVTEKYTLFAQRVRPLLSIVYPAEILDDLTEKLFSQVVPLLQQSSRENLAQMETTTTLF
jgi:hypothetical protein